MTNENHHGGKRPNAGRKANSGTFKEPTKAIRVPQSQLPVITAWLDDLKAKNTQASINHFGQKESACNLFQQPKMTQNLFRQLDSTNDQYLPAQQREQSFSHQPDFAVNNFEIPFYQSSVSAGFPSPADDVIDMTLNLNTHIISNPAATFFVRASGDSMLDEGIHSGDLLVVNRAITAKTKDIVIAAINGELTVKQLHQKNGQITLKARSAGFDDIPITEDMNMHIWGVVTHVIHGLKN